MGFILGLFGVLWGGGCAISPVSEWTIRTFHCTEHPAVVQKYWITNSALHAKWSVVFAQLMMNGNNEGIHAFLVRIRDEQMRPMPKVRIEDMGHKMGCNGTHSLSVPSSRPLFIVHKI